MWEKSIWKRKDHIEKKEAIFQFWHWKLCCKEYVGKEYMEKKRPYRNGRKHLKFCFGN